MDPESEGYRGVTGGNRLGLFLHRRGGEGVGRTQKSLRRPEGWVPGLEPRRRWKGYDGPNRNQNLRRDSSVPPRPPPVSTSWGDFSHPIHLHGAHRPPPPPTPKKENLRSDSKTYRDPSSPSPS